VVDAAEFVAAQESIKSVYVDRLVSEYIVSITAATRNHADVYLGASPRGSLGVYRASQARAAMLGRDYVTPDDVKAVAVPVLSHRVILNAASRMRQVSTETVLGEILNRVAVPGARAVAR
ncbi:MAG: MoxR family ATPase, partial [Chloroflexota bacterium]|nr:MoxR family ATPase [Chloroflexota bacterium]